LHHIGRAIDRVNAAIYKSDESSSPSYAIQTAGHKDLQINHVQVPQVRVHLKFGHCDVRYGIAHAENKALAAQVAVGELDVLLFSFVLVENAMALRAAQWEFVVQLLSGVEHANGATAGAVGDVAEACTSTAGQKRRVVAVVMDSTHRFFPDICDAVDAGCSGWRGFFPTENVVMVPRNKMVLLSSTVQAEAGLTTSSSSVDPEYAAQLQKFRDHNDSQEKWRVREQAKGSEEAAGAPTESGL
jgi:hypothetical protein